MPLARDLSQRFGSYRENREDLFQVACLGVVKAVDRFDPYRGPSLPSYVVPTVLGELKRHIRDQGWSVRVPRELQEQYLRVAAEEQRLAQALGRAPSMSELAAATGLGEEQVLAAKHAGSARDASSLDARLGDADDSAAVVDLVGEPHDPFEAVDRRDAVVQAWLTLPDAEQEVVRLRVNEDLPQREIGDRIGYSQMHVSRLMRRAIGSLAEAAA